MDYKQKYIKYKQKYINTKNQDNIEKTEKTDINNQYIKCCYGYYSLDW